MLMAPMVTNGDSGNIGANGDNDDPLETMVIHWSYNGGSVDNSANGDNGSNGDNGVNGENAVAKRGKVPPPGRQFSAPY